MKNLGAKKPRQTPIPYGFKKDYLQMAVKKR
jgi:hypothetical protein